jgi:hypothetical protein
LNGDDGGEGDVVEGHAESEAVAVEGQSGFDPLSLKNGFIVSR